MKVINLVQATVHYMETDEGEFMRSSSDCWFLATSTSWEHDYGGKKLERLFQKTKREQKLNQIELEKKVIELDKKLDEAISLLYQFSDILKYQKQPMANQGQALDGDSVLESYNRAAEKVQQFLGRELLELLRKIKERNQ